MAKILTPADQATMGLVREVLDNEYPQIAALVPALQIGALMVCSDKTGTPALAKGGYPAAGMIKVVPETDRAAGGPDVLMLLDGDRWPRWGDDKRYALVHHELHHVVPVKLRARGGDEPGYTCDLDSLDRPKVRLRKHDFEIGGFNLIVERHGDNALEWVAVVRVHEAFKQQTLPFVKEKGKKESA